MNNLNNGVMDNDINDNNLKVAKKNRKLMNDSFYITYVLLLTTATVCFIEAVRTKDIKIRNILNLEVCISIVYRLFLFHFYGKD